MEYKSCIFDETDIIVVVGHYGTGKTNFALNVARDAAQAGRAVTLVDLDVVNPYFRSSDYALDLETRGVRLIAPNFAGTSLDTPSLSGTIESALRDASAPDHRSLCIVDAGGDDVGATALGRYASLLAGANVRVVYVVNRYRDTGADVTEALRILREIEQKSHLSVTDIISNAHMQGETTYQHVLDGAVFAQQVADEAGLPVTAVTVPAFVSETSADAQSNTVNGIDSYVIEVFVKLPWDFQ